MLILAGNSGSPIFAVLPDKTFYSIGIHCRDSILNSGVVLGHQGNAINAFRMLSVLRKQVAADYNLNLLPFTQLGGTLLD
jgi:di/tricarboxylate transporter